MDNPYFIVRVSCMAYNHVNFIKQAMDGFCMQETTFPFVCTIVDDSSNDGTQDIIRSYLVNNFCGVNECYDKVETDDCIRIYARHKINKNCFFVVVFLKYNHYSIKKDKHQYFKKWTNTKYIAPCEGDDYWINPKKLQYQIDYLENHGDCGLVHARAKIFNQREQTFRGFCGDNIIEFDDIITRNPVVTLTACYRVSIYNEYMKSRSSWPTDNWKMGDYPLWIWIAYYSKVHFWNEVIAVYREQENSLTHVKKVEDKLAFIDNTKEIQLFFADLFIQDERIKKQIEYNADMKSAMACFKFGVRKGARPFLKKLTLKDRWRIILRH